MTKKNINRALDLEDTIARLVDFYYSSVGIEAEGKATDEQRASFSAYYRGYVEAVELILFKKKR